MRSGRVYQLDRGQSWDGFVAAVIVANPGCSLAVRKDHYEATVEAAGDVPVTVDKLVGTQCIMAFVDNEKGDGGNHE